MRLARRLIPILPLALLLAADDPKPESALNPPVFAELPLGAIKPAGWLKAQLKLQADGLGGHLDEFWPDIKDSAWIGGKAEGWERTPYWLDGAIPLAFLLDDAALKAKVKRFVDYILDHQAPDGWLGPRRRQRPEPQAVRRLAPVRPLQGPDAVPGGHRRPARRPGAAQVLAGRSTRSSRRSPLYSWAHFRGADLVVSLYWLHDKTGDKSGSSTSPRRSTGSRTTGVKHFENFDRFRDKATKFDLDNHGVNNGMGLKFGGMRYRRIGRPEGPRRHLRHARHARPLPRPGHRHLHLRRALRRPQPVAGDRALHRGRGDVFARIARRHHRRRPARRPPRAARLQRLPGDVQEGHVRPPVRPAGQPGRLRRSPTRGSTPTTGPTRTSTAWSRTSAAARPICTRAGPSSRRHLWADGDIRGRSRGGWWR